MITTTFEINFRLGKPKFFIINHSRYPNATYKMIKRGMMSSAQMTHFARAAYFTCSAILNNDIVNNVSINNHKPLAYSLANLSLNHQQGAMQHKTAIAHHMLPHKFNGADFYNPLQEKYPDFLISYEPNVLVDSRIMNELPIVPLYMKNPDVYRIFATLDSRPANFPHQIQENQDYWSFVKLTDNIGGMQIKCVPQDAKAGVHMLKHSSKGSLGLLTYDNANDQNVQVTSAAIPIDSLVKVFDKDHLISLQTVLNHDGLSTSYEEFFFNYRHLFSKKTNNIEDLFSLHNAYQHDLWKIQTDPYFKRSVSFIFTERVSYQDSDDFKLFHDRFISLLGKGNYNLDKRGDFVHVYRAMLLAYAQSVDPMLAKKLYHLHNVAGIQLNPHFMQEVANLLKQGFM